MSLNADDEFLCGFQYLQREVHENAAEHGWWDGEDHNVGEKLALIHSEVSEALEAKRTGDPASKKIVGHSNFIEELADVVIRCMDLAHYLGEDLGAAILAKHEYNKTRPHMHGGKAF